MIEVVLARKLIEQITQYTDYNINIMDDQGVIIASRDPKRVGTFHEVAYYIVTGSEDMVVVSDDEDYPGVRSGINMVIMIDGKREGVVGITGDPKQIKPVALITKVAIEALLKYETQREELLRRRSRKERFLDLLIYEEFSEPAALRMTAKELNYSESIIRIPILCRLENVKPEPFLELIKEGKCHGSEDISFVLDDQHILIFKTMTEDSQKQFSDYKYVIADYLSTALRWLREQGKSGKFYVGTFQMNFSQYYYAYRSCKWLEENVETESKSAFFYDYVGAYLHSIIPRNELQRMFHVYEKELGEEFKKTFLELAGALIHSNYNMVQAAKELFVHKNTLIYRYNKMKEVLNINPITSHRDRLFLEAFYNYLR
ncbi:MAG: sugar diacid recognition domain-containing protein [Lachnospiraceae bacterium]|nr:sugar diacid recognition domain-containing protein [Lachnospiraceae bacterium]